ncbi:CPBP family intramembrane glutamic endopeptidase [Gordonia soli]|uniref:CAAX prenyl protease 2/Lysostaphin resistance protein A-like domain-containing protein n=1 Tax=Gordonia soli NBRC 108243 TaxID=1223545 RepID=M0QLB8_9ACTN|nr:CPBP family intramembrane glutamic endopeptidase [Gordonia soli]GAC69440.1 hypothetical protein GS4_25_00100 [Gordonia soli NBRC 108243]
MTPEPSTTTTEPVASTGLVRSIVSAVFTEAPGDIDSPAALRRRRIVATVFLVAGAVTLGFSLSVDPGDTAFYPLTIGLALIWVIGALASGHVSMGRFGIRRRVSGDIAPAGRVAEYRTTSGAVALGTVVGAAVGGAFLVGALITREIPTLSRLVVQVLDFADYGSIVVVTLITLGNGVAEELFFRGAVYSAAHGYRPLLTSTVLYVIATLASGNPMLGFAAVILGIVCAILRRATGGVLAPICTHVVWAAIVLFALPPIFG